MTEHDDDGRSVSVWMASVRPVELGPLVRDLDADVCIVGAGIAGLSTAYELARAGRSVVVLDDGSVGGGQTKRTTAHLSNAVDDLYCEIEGMHGEEGARLVADSHTAAIDEIESIVEKESIACGFERLSGYLFPGPDSEHELLDAELAAARRAGLASAERLEAGPAGGPPGPCLHFPRQAQFQPLRYLNGLAEAIGRYGGRIFTGTHVSEIEGRDGVVMRTANGCRVKARFGVVATNTPIHERVAIHTKQVGCRTYVVALDATEANVPRALYWDTDDPYHYVRVQSESSSGHELLLVGGEDHRIGEELGEAFVRYTRLERWARRRFPRLGHVVHRWSGEVMEPVDGLAYIGVSPSGPDSLLLATGDSGMGMTHGVIAGILLAETIAGRVHPWANLYSPSRKPTRALGRYLRENGQTLGHYGEWLRFGTSIESIPPDSGAVVQHGARKLAVYRDDRGELHACSAACTHLGGLVGWNDAEKTWDCPCHGARYDRFGRVVHGPANHDLRPADQKRS
jgi:glycine/D-amino acid oxidase-like deaminating enzyme/nitrite reductase/ring-hydroxylating ferredoxin subunit